MDGNSSPGWQNEIKALQTIKTLGRGTGTVFAALYCDAIWHRRAVALHQEKQHAMSNRPLKLLCFIIAATLSPGAIFWFWAILLLLLFDGPKGFLFDLALFAGLVIVMAIVFFIGASIKAKFDKRKYDKNLQAYKDEMAKAKKSLPEREAASSGRRL